jgi:hypothetical protein
MGEPDETFFPLIDDRVTGVYGNMSQDELRAEVSERVEYFAGSSYYLDHPIPPLPRGSSQGCVH